MAEEQNGIIAQEIGQLEYDENRRLVLRMFTAVGAALASEQAGARTWQRITTGVTGNEIDVAAAALSGGVLNSVIVTSTGEAWACGDNAQGQLGQGNYTDLTLARAMKKNTDNQNLTGVKQVAVGGLASSYTVSSYAHSLAMTSGGEVWGTGSNGNGQLGNGNTISTTKLVKMSGISNATAIDTGAAHTLVLTANGRVYATGLGDNGQLGDGASGNDLLLFPHDISTPAAMKDTTNAVVTDAVGMGAGKFHSFVIRGGTSRVWATGLNTSGQLGLGNLSSRNKLTDTGVTNAKAVTGGSAFSLILKNDGTVVGTGDNTLGQLGNGTTTDRSTWGAMTLPRSAIAISGTWNHTLILLDDGTVRACGYGYWGRLGNDNGGSASQIVPAPVLNVSNIVGLGSGDYHSLMLRADGRIFSVGLNNSGQLGNGTTLNLSIATKMVGI